MDTISDLWNDFVTWWTGSSIGKAIDADAQAAISELESIGASQAETAGLTIAEAALGGLASGGAAGAFAAGIAAAPAALNTAEKNISNATINTLVSSVVNQIQAQQSGATSQTGNVTTTSSSSGAA